jgi:hypothetical protein
MDLSCIDGQAQRHNPQERNAHWHNQKVSSTEVLPLAFSSSASNFFKHKVGDQAPAIVSF